MGELREALLLGAKFRLFAFSSLLRHPREALRFAPRGLGGGGFSGESLAFAFRHTGELGFAREALLLELGDTCLFRLAGETLLFRFGKSFGFGTLCRQTLLFAADFFRTLLSRPPLFGAALFLESRLLALQSFPL